MNKEKPWQEEVGKAIDEAAEKTEPMVSAAFISGIEAMVKVLYNQADKLNKIKEQYAMGDIHIREAEKKLNMILQEIGKWKP